MLDSTETPAEDIEGLGRLVQEAQNDYWNASVLAGYALTDKTDLQAQYFYYRADNFRDNWEESVPYGMGAEEHGVTATIAHQFSKSLRGTLKYGFFDNREETFGGHKDYSAHLLYTSLQYRF